MRLGQDLVLTEATSWLKPEKSRRFEEHMTVKFIPFVSPSLYGAIDEHEQNRLELIIATARGFLAALALLAIHLDPTEPTRYAELAFNLLVLYDLHSFAVLLLLRFGPIRTARLGPLFHAIDLAWAVTITFLTEGPNSSFFALFVFVLLAAATRWGFRETLLTGTIAAALFLLEAFAATFGLVVAILDISSIIMRGAYFMLATFLLAYLSEQAKGLRASGNVINSLAAKVNIRDGLVSSTKLALGQLLRLVGSTKALIVLEEPSTRRLVVWETSGYDAGEVAEINAFDVQQERRAEYLSPLPNGIASWQVTRSNAKRMRRSTIAIREDGSTIGRPAIETPAALGNMGWTTLLGFTFGFGDEWKGRLFLFDPTAYPGGVRRLRFLQTVVAQVTPVLQNVYLLRRVRQRVGALERARVARDLHDSVLQSLTSIDMQLEVARRRATLAPRPAGELEHIQGLLKTEILNIRDLMEHLRPRVTSSKHLVERLADLADRVQRETGIEVACHVDIGDAELAPELCHELMRVTQEALTNARKHSGASSVNIQLKVDDWAWKLTIRDNGRGFGFVGTLSHAELVSRRAGPRTIRERIEAVGGKLQVQSGADGVRLEMIGRLKKPWILTPSA